MTVEVAVISTTVITLSAGKWFNSGVNHVLSDESYRLLCTDTIYTQKALLLCE